MWLQSSVGSLTEAGKVHFKCLLVRGDTPWCSETLTFMCLKVLPIYEASKLLHVNHKFGKNAEVQEQHLYTKIIFQTIRGLKSNFNFTKR